MTDEKKRKRDAANATQHWRYKKDGKECWSLPMDSETVELSLCKAQADTLEKDQQRMVLAELCGKLLRDVWLFSVSDGARDDGLLA